MTPLSLAPAGTPVTIMDVRGGQHLRRRLADLGLTPGTVVKVVQAVGHGPLILALGDGRLALGRGASHKILVAPLLAGN
jgi:ferrous iron transport protein A